MHTIMSRVLFARAGKPIAPVGPLAIHAYSHDSVTLSWRAPEGVDAWSITGYRVEKREVSRGTWEVVGNVDAADTSFTVRGLRAGTDYYFRVIAENGAGASQPLTLDRSFVPRTPYGEQLNTSLRTVYKPSPEIRSVAAGMISGIKIPWGA